MKRILLIMLFSVACVSNVFGAFCVTDYSVVYNEDCKDVTFSMTFNKNPNFFTIDDWYRQSNSFQFAINYDSVIEDDFYHTGNRNINTVIRGCELFDNDSVRVRDNETNWVIPLSDIKSGGWGRIVTEVPYSLAGACMSFNVPLSYLHGDGSFSYTLMTLDYGSSYNYYTPTNPDEEDGGGYPLLYGNCLVRDDSDKNPVPEPASILLFAPMLMGLIGFKIKKSGEDNRV